MALEPILCDVCACHIHVMTPPAYWPVISDTGQLDTLQLCAQCHVELYITLPKR